MVTYLTNNIAMMTKMMTMTTATGTVIAMIHISSVSELHVSAETRKSKL